VLPGFAQGDAFEFAERFFITWLIANEVVVTLLSRSAIGKKFN